MFCTPHKPSRGSQTRTIKAAMTGVPAEPDLHDKETIEMENHGRDLGMKSFEKLVGGRRRCRREEKWRISGL